MRTITGRRAVVATVAAVTTVAMSAPSAGAAATGPDIFEGAAEALAFDLTLSAPGDLLSVVPGVTDGTLRQLVSQTGSTLSSAGDATVVTTLLKGLLNESLPQDAKTEARKVLVEQDIAGLLSVKAGEMIYQADPAAGITKSSSTLAELRVGLSGLLSGQLAAPVDAVADLQETVDAAVGTVEDLVGDLNGVLGEVETAVNQVTEAAPVDLPVLSLADLPVDPAKLLEGDLLTVEKLWSESLVRTAADAVESTSKAGIVRATLLGGLVDVPAFTYTSFAKTNGKPGGAVADATVTEIAVKLAGSDIVKLEDGVLSVGDVTIATELLEQAQAQQLLGQIQTLLNDVLNAAGLNVSPGATKTFAAPDGSRAEASTSAFAVSLTPLNVLSGVLGAQASELQVALNLLPTKAVAAASVKPVVAAPPPAAPPAAPNLPRTGGGALAVVAGGLAMAAALGLRRATR